MEKEIQHHSESISEIENRSIIILRGNRINGCNVLHQDMMTIPNTIYEIRYDFTLNDQIIELPNNCVLKFSGGSINCGILVGNSTIFVHEDNFILGDELNLEGSFVGNITPANLGFTFETTGEENFHILYKTHLLSNRTGLRVSYENIEKINVEIPSNATASIPLVGREDFSNCLFKVSNNTKDKFSLFALGYTRAESVITLDKSLLKNVDFTSIDIFRKGKFLLIVKDENVWCERYQNNTLIENVKREDVIYIEDGYARNMVIAPYLDDSTPSFTYVDLSDADQFFVKNIQFHREKSTVSTILIQARGLSGVLFDNISLWTDKDDFTTVNGDSAIRITACANVTLQNIHGMNSYAGVPAANYGYVLTVINIFNLVMRNVSLNDNNYGAMGGRYLNSLYIDKCTLDRIDIHVYGKDVIARDTIINGKYNQFGNMYGDVVFEGCQFINAEPVRVNHTYVAFTPYNLYLRNCLIEGIDYIVNTPNISTRQYKALRQQNEGYSFPNIFVDSLRVTLNATSNFRIFKYNSAFTPLGNFESVSGIKKIELRDIRINRLVSEEASNNFYITVHETPFANNLRILIDNCDFGEHMTRDKIKLQESINYRLINHFNTTNLNTGGHCIIRNSTLMFPTNNNNNKFAFTFEDCILTEAYNSQSIMGIRYYFKNCELHFTRNQANQFAELNAEYSSCIFNFYTTPPKLSFRNVNNWGICEVKSSCTNVQNISSVLSENEVIPYSEDTEYVIKGELLDYTKIVNLDNTRQMTKSVSMMPFNSDRTPIKKSVVMSHDNNGVTEFLNIQLESNRWFFKPIIPLIVASDVTNLATAPFYVGTPTFISSMNKQAYWNGVYWVDSMGYDVTKITKGSTANRPNLTIDDDGFEFYDVTLKKKILWNGTIWTNIDGSNLI